MKQREYTELQWAIINVINRMAVFMQHNSNAQKEIDNIRKDYDIKEPYLTLRDYIVSQGCGAYHTFHFTLKDKEISIIGLNGMLTDELCTLYPLTKEFYVVNDKRKDNGLGCDQYHCDHYLTLEPKED